MSLAFTYAEEPDDMTISGSNQTRDELATTTHTNNKCLNLGTATCAHLSNLGGVASDSLNYTTLHMVLPLKTTSSPNSDIIKFI
jgi:hypothetical protein